MSDEPTSVAGVETGQDDTRRPVDQTAQFADVIAARVRKLLRSLKRDAAGVHPRSCPLCDYYGAFTPYGFPLRFDAQCAKCGSLERHRLVKLLLDRKKVIGPGHSVLHFAPEPQLGATIRALAGHYVTADLMRPRVDLKLNIEAMDLADDSFDRIVCCQILEHVDDRKALAEMFRVLRPGGVALLNTPVIEGWDETYENPEIDGARMRLLHFGQADHVRYYGRDLRDRITAAGFALEEFNSVEPDVSTYGLWRGERIFLARKPALGTMNI
ncbi:methyltransferase domain-containing protein [Frigidibacter sp. SD6-1]|uniref:methyltransferase domain-containing protein n=1 Tax=Frigidibacter sp. SD6-1 TaxID=3032581 RepID=UPI0024DFFFF1|nr:methyltransferase domain-containing protein [Frigidibacter sp. SD6-1]